MIRDIGCGFTASYSVLPNGSHEVRFFRNGRKLATRVFKHEDDAIRALMKTTRDQLIRSTATA